MAGTLKLKNAKDGEVVTRFPPEASGYIHIGHTKAALVNYMLAKQYKGKMILRFDDTNCDKEKHEYEEAILEDLKRVGITWDIGPTYTSDYFPQMLEMAEQMIKNDKAYCDNTPKEEMQKHRFDGTPTKCRANTVEENLAKWEEMKKASEEGLTYCLRAKLSVDNANKALRDPVIFRCNLTPHPRQGDKFKVYPTYDLACPVVDSLEGVTHALRTSEYLDRNDQYKWMIKALGLRMPSLDDFSRLNMEYTVMSKRKLTQFVDDGKVWGWDDPRMPTTRGLMRRGVHVDALWEFVKVQGMSKVANTMEWEKIWNLNKKIIDPIAPRYTCVDQFRIPVTMEGTAEVTHKECPLHKKNAAIGTKQVAYGPKMFLEEQDVVLLSEGEEVTLLDWGNAFVKTIEKDEAGKPKHVTMTLHLEGDFKTTKQKLSWVADVPANVPVLIYEFDHLITERNIDKQTDLDSVVREVTSYKLDALGEEGLKEVKKGDIIQFQRRGFYICDAVEPVMTFFFIPDGHLKQNHLSAMARWGPPPPTLADRKERADSEALKQKTGGLPAGEPSPAPKKSNKQLKKEAEAAKKAATAAPHAETTAAPAAEGDGEGEKKESKSAAKKREKEEAKKKAAAEREAAAAAKAAEALEKIKDRFGNLPMVQSTTYCTKKYTTIGELAPTMEGKEVLVRGRVHTVRAKGKLGFCTLRGTPFSVQCVISESEAMPKEAVKWVGSLSCESLVDCRGKIVLPEKPITSVTQSEVELHIESMFLVSAAPPQLPFVLDDASRKDMTAEEVKAAAAEGALTITVSQDARLNARWLDMRTKANHAIFQLQHKVSKYFREYLESVDFVEIHSPKIIATASEGGANVFKLGYFGKDAFLAQSPQLYKQMALMGDLHRVYEIGPVFRAENSNTHRHLTEFVGLDLEMTIFEHYYEVLDVAEELFAHIFTQLNAQCKPFLEMVREQHPFEDLEFQVPEETIRELGMEVIDGSLKHEVKDEGKVRNLKVRSLRLDFPTGVKMINAKLPDLRALSCEELFQQHNIKAKDEAQKQEVLKDMGANDDLSTSYERLLGKLVKAKYGVDFFILDRYPSPVRPFYTMPCPDDAAFTNSYDMFIRGEEISSGAQRIHNAELLLERAKSLGVDMTPIVDYVNSFRLGAYPHGGFGVGLERVVMLFLGLHNIRKASLYPRDPLRVTP
jgi:glutamyl-tRNA synthetase